MPILRQSLVEGRVIPPLLTECLKLGAARAEIPIHFEAIGRIVGEGAENLFKFQCGKRLCNPLW